MVETSVVAVGDPTEPGAAGVGRAGAVGTSAGGAGAGGAGVVDPRAGVTALLQPASPLPAPSPYTEQIGGLIDRLEPASRPASPVRTGHRVPRPCHLPVHGTHAMALRPSSVPLRVPLPPPPESSLPAVPDPESDRARTSTTASALVAQLVDFAAACRLDYATALVAESESASLPPVGSECALGTDVLDDRVKRLPGSPPAFKARYVARGFSQRQGVDYFQTFSPTPKMTTLRVLLHVADQRDYELHSLDFSTQWSLRRPVYGLCQAPREWHDTLGTTLAALGFAPSTAHPSLFLCTDTSLPPFYILVYPDDLVFATADTEALTVVKSELHKRHTCTDLEPSGPYPELVGCLMYLMTCTRPDLAYPLSLLARYVAPGRHRKRSSQGYTFSLGSGSVSWRSTRSSSVLNSSCEAEIYAGAMAAQELRWLTYLLTDLGEQPRLPPILYQCGQLRLAYMATRANTADIFTKALPPSDHQRFSTVLGLVPTLPHLLSA
ncbi:unnamed protein product [Closterium sp. NIES-53]